MSKSFFYCSELSRQRGEPPYGTASAGDVWLLLEYPYWWGTQAFADSALPADVKAHLTHALETIPRSRLLLIKQDRPRRPQLKFFVVRAAEDKPFSAEFTLDDYTQLLQLDIAGAATGRAHKTAIDPARQLFLICTHGRRDKCCAKFGYPLYKSLRAAGAGANVWQSTHVGGDRFAANLVCFPHGLFYARVTEVDAQTITAAYRTQQLVLNRYRGRACYTQPVQAAEYFVRAESGLLTLDALRLRARARIADNSWRVVFNAPATGSSYEVTISSRVSEFHQLLTCAALEEKSVVQFGLDHYRVTHDPALAHV